ncbi:MAG: hypothetical protein AAFX01_12170 [Cyanobacteria bacterium J06638_28]
MQSTDDKSREHLKLLSIFHYIYGGIAGALSLFSVTHLAMGISFISSPNAFPSPEPLSPAVEEAFPFAFFGWMFVVIGLIALVLGLTFAVCLIVSGRCLAQRKRYWFSFIVACFACLSLPLGTILGVFTLVVLSRSSVKTLYGLNQA